MSEHDIIKEVEAVESYIADFYNNKSVLITGGSGFLGKIIIDKLLRSCPSLKQVYVLMRAKRNKQPEERFQELFTEPLFDLVRNEDHLLQKVVMVEGDITRKNLGLSKEDSSRIVKEVSVIFHVAASVRFNEPLKTAININLVGTKNVIELSRKLARLAALVYVSTAYTNCDRNEVDEHVYPINMDPDNLIQISNLLDQDTLEELKLKLLADRPNTYTYTKALAEWLLVKTARDLPVVVCRPSIITACWKEPLRGWIDNIQGATGFHLDMCKGILRSMLGEPSCVVDLIPADTVSNLIISLAWFAELYQKHKLLNQSNSSSMEKLAGQQLTRAQGVFEEDEYMKFDEIFLNNSTSLATGININDGQDNGYQSARKSSNNLTSDSVQSCGNKDADLSLAEYEKYDDKLNKFKNQNKLRLAAEKLPEEIADVPVFHCTSGSENPLTWDTFTSLFIAAFVIFPCMMVYRYPSRFMTSKKWLNSFYNFTLHYLPAYLMDFITKLRGGEGKFVKICKRMDSREKSLKRFTLNEWKFSSENVSMLRNEIMACGDKDVFNFDIRSLYWPDYITDYVIGLRKYVLKESLGNLAKARRNINFVYYRNLCLKVSSVLLLLGFMQYKRTILIE